MFGHIAFWFIAVPLVGVGVSLALLYWQARPTTDASTDFYQSDTFDDPVALYEAAVANSTGLYG